MYMLSPLLTSFIPSVEQLDNPTTQTEGSCRLVEEDVVEERRLCTLLWTTIPGYDVLGTARSPARPQLVVADWSLLANIILLWQRKHRFWGQPRRNAAPAELDVVCWHCPITEMRR